MKKFWSACLTKHFGDPWCLSYALEDSTLFSGNFDMNDTELFQPKEDFDLILEEVKKHQKETGQKYTIFQFFVPERGMKELLDCAYHGLTGEGRTNKGFEIRIVEDFVVSPK